MIKSSGSNTAAVVTIEDSRENAKTIRIVGVVRAVAQMKTKRNRSSVICVGGRSLNSRYYHQIPIQLQQE